MSIIWTKERAINASIGARKGKYEAIPEDKRAIEVRRTHPHLFKFEAVSVGDSSGQMFFVPLDESSEETAHFILKAIKFYIENNNE